MFYTYMDEAVPRSMETHDIVEIVIPERIIERGCHLAPGQLAKPVNLPQVVTKADAFLAPGHVIPETRAAWPLAGKMIRRIVPWAEIYIAPKIFIPFSEDDAYCDGRRRFLINGASCTELGGLSLNIDGTVLLTSGSSPQNLLSMAAHEAWHSLEVRMSAAEIESIDAQLNDRELNLAFHGYFDSMVERRVGAFQMWCMRLVAGLPGHFVRTATAGASMKSSHGPGRVRPVPYSTDQTSLRGMPHDRR